MRRLFVFAADTHLQPNAWAKRPQISGDAYDSFSQIVAYCLQHHLPLVLGGDIFDRNRPDPVSVSHMAYHMLTMEQRKVPVYYIQGDHDKADFPWLNAISPWPVHLHNHTVEVGGYRIRGIDHRPPGRLEEPLAAVPADVNFLVTHQAWQELQGIGAVEGSLAAVPAHVNLVLTGDYHVANHWVVKRPGAPDVLAYSPGSTCMQSLSESPAKTFIEVCIDEEFNNLVISRHPLMTRPYYRFDLETPESLSAFCGQDFARLLALPEGWQLHGRQHIAVPILHIRYRDDLPDAKSRIEDVAGQRFHVVLQPQHVAEEIEVSLEAAPDGTFETLLDAIRCLSQDSTEDYDMARRLLDAEDRLAELDKMKQEFLDACDSADSAGVVPTSAPGV